MNTIEAINSLVKALNAGGYDAAPGSLVNGSAIQTEDLSPVMEVTTFEDKHIKLQKLIKSESCKSMTYQFNRQLSYGQFGGSATLEGHVGQQEDDDIVRVTVPMCFYSHLRKHTLAAGMVATFDGVKPEDRLAASAAKKIAADIEFDVVRGKDDFSNSGLFDANPLAMPALPNMLGLTAQIRQSDYERNAQDLMFNEYGSNSSVVIAGGGTLSQENIEDAHTRSLMNMGEADMLLVDPLVASNYNKIAYGKDRIILAGSPQEAQGANLKKQWVSGGDVVDIEVSRFLSGKTAPQKPRISGPAAPTFTGASVTISGTVTSFALNDKYYYTVTAVNEVGESTAAAAAQVQVAVGGDSLQLTITPGSGTTRYFNVYRSLAGGSAASVKFIGRVIAALSGNTTFVDLNNKMPGFVTGVLVEGDTMEMRELAPYSRVKMAMTELAQAEAFFRFTTLAVFQPRKNVIVDNLK